MLKFSLAVGATALALAGAGVAAVVHDHEDELAVVYDDEDDGDRCGAAGVSWAGPVNAQSSQLSATTRTTVTAARAAARSPGPVQSMRRPPGRLSAPGAATSRHSQGVARRASAS